MSYDLGTAHGKIELEYEGRKEAREAEKDMEGLERQSRDTDASIRKLGKSFSTFLGGVASAGKMAVVAGGLASAGIQAANLGIQIAGIIPQLTSVLSLGAALPATFLGAAAAIGTLKAATAGVGEALEAAFDPEGAKKFEEALKKLSPAAQGFARAVKANVGPLKEYQLAIQEAFFSNAVLDKAVLRGMFVLNQLRPTVLGLAQDFGKITDQVVKLATTNQSIAFLQNSVKGFRAALSEASTAIGPLFIGLRSVGEVGLPLLTRLGEVVGSLGTRFGEWMQEIAASGQLQEWINTALATLRTLGTILGNVGSILNSIFTAAGQTGGGLLNVLAQITGQFAAFLKSAEGAAAIRSLFTGIGQVASQLAPVITTLVGALAGALGPALSRLATEIGPVLLQVVQELTPAFAPLANAIVTLLEAVAPLAPPLAKLIAMLAQLAAGAVNGLVAELGPLIEMIGTTLMQAFVELTPLIGQFAQFLPVAAEAGLELARAFAPLMPIIVELARVFATELVAVMPQLVDAIRQIIPLFVQLAEQMGGTLAEGLTQLTKALPFLIQGFAKLLPIIVQVLGIGLRLMYWAGQLGIGIRNLLGAIISFGISLRDNLVSGLQRAYNGVVSAGAGILRWFQELPGKVMSFLAALPGRLWSLLGNMMHRAAFLLGAGIGVLVTVITRAPGMIINGIKALPGLLWNLIRNTWNVARNLFLAGVNGAVSLARTLPGRVASGVRSLVSNLGNLARNAWNGLRTAFVNGVNNAVSLARSLPGRIRAGIGNLAGMMAGLARDAINGFVNGITGGIGRIGGAARSLGNSLLSGLKSTLKIGSPSREMIAIGRFVTQGLHNGLMGSAKQVQSAANKIANMVNDAFREGLISRRQRNSAINSIVGGNRALVKLANQSASVATRLKDAQSKLAEVTKSYNDVYASSVQKTKETFELVTAGQRFVDLDRTKARFQEAVNQARAFAANIQNLAKRGLSKDLLQQLVNAGAADGGAMAAALAQASDATLKEFNNLQGQLNTSATTVGKVTAEALYGAGVRAAQGLVKGLQTQQAAIQKLMDKIADAMVARLKKALKIKSPSRLMFDIGQFTTEGLVNGLESLRRQVELAAQKLATASIAPTVRLTTQQEMARTVPALARYALPAPVPQAATPTGQREYTLQIGDKTFLKFVVDALTGAPVEVKKATDEGSRRSAWSGSGR